MSLIRLAFWVGLFAVSTFLFVVFFEYGTTNFVENSKKEFASVKKLLGLDKEPEKKDVLLQ